MVVCARRAAHAGAERHGDLDAERADSACRRVHQDGVTGTDADCLDRLIT